MRAAVVMECNVLRCFVWGKKKSSSFYCTRVEIKSPSVKVKEDTYLHVSLGIIGTTHYSEKIVEG